MTIRTIICLANSRKPPSGRCIAGKVFKNNEFGTWIRPVSLRPSHEVSEDERRYEGGLLAQLLDIIKIPLSQHAPTGHQVENYQLDPAYYWEKVDKASWLQVNAALDAYDPVFWSNHASTYHGTNDKVAEAFLPVIGSSLKLISVPDLQIVVKLEDGFEGNPGRRRVRASFTYEGHCYRLSVSDPKIEEEYLQKANGTYEVGSAILCISLVEVFHSFAFRVVASIITPAICKP